MKAPAGTVVSLASTVLYGIVSLAFVFMDPFFLMQGEGGLGEFLARLVLNIAFLPFIVLFKVIAVVIVASMVLGVVLIATGRTVPGGILVLAFSGFGFLLSMFMYFIPLVLGVAGGILALNEK